MSTAGSDLRLEGTRCLVRRWRMRDADALVRHGNNANIAKHLRDRFPHPYTRAEARSFLSSAAGRSGDQGSLAIEVGGEAVGAIGFSPGIDVERFSAEIGYWLSEAYWGRGIATDALRLVTDELFARRMLLRLFALPFADNPASARVLEKVGYRREALLRSSGVKYGQVKDQLLYALVNQHWRFDAG